MAWAWGAIHGATIDAVYDPEGEYVYVTARGAGTRQDIVGMRVQEAEVLLASLALAVREARRERGGGAGE